MAPSGQGGTAAPLWEAADALRRVDASSCFVEPDGGAPERRRVRVTFGTTGRVIAVAVERGPAAGTPEGKCLVGAFQSITIPPYRGGAFSLRRESSRFRGSLD